MNRMWRTGALAVASVMMGGCAHGTGVVVEPPDWRVQTPSTEQAVARFEEATQLFAELDRGEWDGEACHRALAAFEHANEAMGGRSGRAVYMSGLVASRCGNADGATQLYSRAIELEPALCEPRVAIGLAELDRGHRAEARRAFEAAVRNDNRCAPGYVNLAILQSESPDEHQAALANLRRALAVRADYMPALDWMALVYLSEADAHPEMLELAEVVCRQAQLVDPAYASIYNTWGLIDVERGELTRAAAHFARAAELDPRFFEAQMNFAELTLSQRAYEDAAGAFRQAHELRPRSYEAALGLGVALRGLRDPEAAESMYREALELDADRPEAYFDLAVLYHEHRDGSVEQLGQALGYLREFVQRAGGEPRFRDTVREVTRWCDPSPRGRHRRAPRCTPGRAQNILTARHFQQGGDGPVERPDWLR